MKRGSIMVLLLVLMLVPGVPAYGAMSGGSPEKIMDAADKAISEGDLDGSIEKLEAIEKDGLPDKSLSRLHFLLGKAKYVKISKDIRSCRSEGTQKRGELQEHQIEPLVESLDHMMVSYKYSMDSEWTPEVLYASGLIQDFSCLQRFEGAMESYQTLAEKYPDTNLGKAAKKKFDFLKSRYGDKGHGQSHP